MTKPVKPKTSSLGIFSGLIAALLYVGDAITYSGDTIMAVVDDLKAAVANLTDAVTASVTALDDLAAKLAASGSTDPAVADAITAINAEADALRAAVAKDDPPV